ncbi:MAG: ABC transporter permease [Limisphaerales bacterium]
MPGHGHRPAGGILTAARRGHWEDYMGSFLAILTVCIPSFVVAPILILACAIKFASPAVALWESPWHMILPVIALGLFFAGKISRLMREGMLNAAQSEFVTAARAKGLGETALLFKHAFRIALLPVVSYSGPMLADLLTGSFIVEKHFSDSRHRCFSREQCFQSRLHRRCRPFAALRHLVDRPESGCGFCLHLARSTREI